MSRSRETFNKKEVRNKKEKKRKDKEKKRLAKKENSKATSLDDMIAYVDENGMITSTPPDPNKKNEIELDDIEVSIPKNSVDNTRDSLRHGVLTYFNESKGYGFIKDSDTHEQIFTHINNFIDEIAEQNSVNYEVEMGSKGPVALHVRLDS